MTLDYSTPSRGSTFMHGGSARRTMTVLALLVTTALFLHGHNRPQIVPPHKRLANFPRTVGPWSCGPDIPFDQETLAVLGPGDYLERTCVASPGSQPVDLLLAYVPSQHTRDWIHSPKHCLPGSGWSPVLSDRIELLRPHDGPAAVNRYVLEKGADRQVVVYWYQAHGRIVASEYWARIYLISDSIELNRADESLVRVITPILEGEPLDTAQKRAVRFAENILPYLDDYIPR